jgi:type IX secretion system PorP/SprF family membrane protein
MFKQIIAAVSTLLFTTVSRAQDPHFSQFFSSPLTVSPAMTANMDADWRVVGNYRQQWAGPAASYNTGTISYDSRILKQNTGNNIFGCGVMIMYDESFYRIVKSTYASVTTAYHKILDADGYQYLGLGFGAVYGQRHIAFDQLTWEEQFTTGGFNTALPTGETGLSNMKPFLSLNTGAVYSLANDITLLEVGGSAFHINKPKQTFLKDEQQVVPARYVGHAAFDHLLSRTTFMNVNAVYQQQARLNYWIFGGAIGKILQEDQSTMISAGAWYRDKDAIFPFISFYKNGWQFGFSYDVTTSKLNLAKPPKSWEISISFRQQRDEADRRTKCPASLR